VREGSFREDLLFRLDIVCLEVPPLRQRSEDLPALAAHFLALARSRHPASPVQTIAPEAMGRIMAHAWPGNVRELENVIERAVLLGRTSEVSVTDLPRDIGMARREELPFAGPVRLLDDVARRYARWAITQLGGRKMLTADKLGIDRKTLARLLGGDDDDSADDV
jgi:DNA-binding NtrC family response regulator